MHHEDHDAHNKLAESYYGYRPLAQDSESTEPSILSNILISILLILFVCALFNLKSIYIFLENLL